MPGDDNTIIIDQNWIGKPKRPNAFCDLIDLFIRMGARVSRIGFEFTCCDKLDIFWYGWSIG